VIRLLKRKTKNEKTAADVLPAHIGFIMDGNRTWAKQRGQPGIFGHRRGAEVCKMVSENLIKRGVNTVSFFAFSTENWAREKSEVKFLMDFIESEMPNHVDHAMKNNIRIKVIGRKDTLSKKIVRMCEKFEKQTSENTAGTICFCLDYGGQDEIVRAAQSAIISGVPADELDADMFESFMDSGDLVPMDLMVRPGGHKRISNFMLWKLAYAELMFIDENWPEVNEKTLDKILAEFNTRKRKFGK